MIAIRRILCPVDISPISRPALDRAAVLAGWYGAELTVLHVVGPLMPTLFGLEPAFSDAPLPPVDAEMVAVELQTFVGNGVGAKRPPQLVVRSGGAARTILSYAQEATIDLVVLGTHGRSGFERFMLGSVTEKVLRKAPCPVLTVPPETAECEIRPAFSRILCGVDFSEASDRAVRYALSLAKEAQGRLTLVHVLEWLPDDSFAKYPQFDLGQYRRSLRSDARLRLQGLVPEEARSWCDPYVPVQSGKAYEEILRLAEQDGVDLIVLGVQGRGPVDRMLFGSTTQQVVRRAHCPVLTIRS